ncbi:arsenical pump-driving ATPase [Spirochaeta dissipatitropha]
MQNLLTKIPRYTFFTGKGGVGKTSMACATALALADQGIEQGKKVLLISTDPASNLDEVLGTELGSRPTAVQDAPNLFALNIDPIQAAAEYRERMVGPYRGVLPDTAVQQMEEQLSGACTVEIAGFNEFSKLLGDDETTREYDTIILDTAPTGHTLRLLNLPAAWTDFIADNTSGSSCLGPVAGLQEQQQLFTQVVDALKNPDFTLLVLVTRPEPMALFEAERAGIELGDAGMKNKHLIINGVFECRSGDRVAEAFAEKSRAALADMPAGLIDLPHTKIPFLPAGLTTLSSLRQLAQENTYEAAVTDHLQLLTDLDPVLDRTEDWTDLIDGIEADGSGVIMTMGKGGVGKTTMAAAIAAELARRGHEVVLSTTDPAAHVSRVIGTENVMSANLAVERIDPKVETERYVAEVIERNRGVLADDDMALLEEEMRSPCIEEIAVFQAFAQTVARGDTRFVVLDTAPTGHTLLLLDATQSYHREVAKSVNELPEAVQQLLPRVRDPRYTKVLVVALPEATPSHEAAALQQDLQRAGIQPFAWIINRSFAVSGTEDPVLTAKGYDELRYISEIVDTLADRTVISPWLSQELDNPAAIRQLFELPDCCIRTRTGSAG